MVNSRAKGTPELLERPLYDLTFIHALRIEHTDWVAYICWHVMYLMAQDSNKRGNRRKPVVMEKFHLLSYPKTQKIIVNLSLAQKYRKVNIGWLISIKEICIESLLSAGYCPGSKFMHGWISFFYQL